MNHIKRYVYIGIGIVSLVIGSIGVFIPILPTVPFLLLSVFCFGRSSKKLYEFIIRNRYFGETIRRYQAGEGVTKGTKIRAILFTTLGIGFSIYKIGHLHSKIAMAVIWLAVVTHIIMIRNYKEPAKAKMEAELSNSME